MSLNPGKAAIFTSLALFVTHFANHSEDGKSKSTGAVQTMKTANAEITVSVDHHRSASNCPVRIEIRNIGAVTLNIFDWGDEALDCRLKLTDRDGRACPYTRHGAGTMQGRIGSVKRVVIGFSAPLKIVIPSEKYFVLSPGDWLLECQVVLNDGKKDCTSDVPAFRFSIP